MSRKPKKIPQVITKEDFKKILNAILKEKKKYRISFDKKFIRIRNCFMIYFAYYLGLRPRETRCIKIEHINFEGKTLFIPAENNKQRNQDTIPIPDFLFDSLFAYLQKRIHKNSIWLFPSYRNPNQPIDRGTHMRFFGEAIKGAGLSHIAYIDADGKKRRNLTLYSLRHSFGTNVYLKLKDIPKTAILLRHYDFQYRTTLRYIHTSNNLKRKELLNEIYS